MISGYFRSVELKIKDIEIVADKSLDYREFSAVDGALKQAYLRQQIAAGVHGISPRRRAFKV